MLPINFFNTKPFYDFCRGLINNVTLNQFRSSFGFLSNSRVIESDLSDDHHIGFYMKPIKSDDLAKSIVFHMNSLSNKFKGCISGEVKAIHTVTRNKVSRLCEDFNQDTFLKLFVMSFFVIVCIYFVCRFTICKNQNKYLKARRVIKTEDNIYGTVLKQKRDVSSTTEENRYNNHVPINVENSEVSTFTQENEVSRI